MGGRGSYSSGGGGGMVGASGGGGQSNIANQAPSASNTPVVVGAVTKLSQMTDDQLTALYNQSRNVDMPNHLSDVKDVTQKFVYTAGINEKPTVLDDAQFNQYLKDNGIPKNDVLARSVGGANYTVNGTTMRLTPTQVTDMTKYSELNYIGGKNGGQVFGAGTYFDMNGGRNTGYGGETMIAVLSPNAKTISRSALYSQTQSWARSHPKFANAVGAIKSSNMSIYALAQGYNVITDGAGSYHNVIDRSAIVVRKSNL